MGKILKSLLYQMKIGYLWKKVWAMLLLVFGVCLVIDIWLEREVGTVTKALAQGDNIMAVAMFVPIFAVLATAEICGNDFGDKTINHELLSGHSRAQVYFARVGVSAMVSVLWGIGLIFLPMALFGALGYWGDTLEVQGALLRLLLCAFPLLRICCETVFLTCVLKNTYLSSAIAGFAILFESSLEGFFRNLDPYWMSGTNMTKIFDFSGDWFTYSIQDLRNHSLYQSMPDETLVVKTILLSLVIGSIFLVFGYVFFKKDDLR